jgi:hypothetical protein
MLIKNVLKNVKVLQLKYKFKKKIFLFKIIYKIIFKIILIKDFNYFKRKKLNYNTLTLFFKK